MPDNVAVTPGVGATVAADDIGGVLYQRVKIAQGADGAAADVHAGAPLNVQQASLTTANDAVLAYGTQVEQAASVIRPADTLAYAANDGISDSTAAPTSIVAQNVARANAGSGYITKVRLVTNQASNTATIRIWLFNAAPTMPNDNAAYQTIWSERASRIGYVDVTMEGTGSDCSEGVVEGARLPFVCAALDADLYLVFQTLTAFTPASGQTFTAYLTAEQN